MATTYHLKKNQRILILGEMDFSFALSIVRMLGNDHKVIATSYHGVQNESKLTNECQITMHQNIKKLKKYRHQFNNIGPNYILRNIDATNLRQSLVKQLKPRVGERILFDRVIFALPKTEGTGTDNRKFMEDMIEK